MMKILDVLKEYKKKIIKIFVIIITVIGLVLGFSFKEQPSLNAMGSTTVLPLFESLSQKYYQDTKGKISVSPGGSTVGLRLIQQNNFLNFGNASRYPKLNNDEYNSNFWHENLSTLTLGYDVIVFAVNLNNTGYVVSSDISTSKNFHVSPDEIYGLYTGKYSSLSDMFNDNGGPSAHGLITDGQISANSKIIVREVGSGTRDSFFSSLNKYEKINNSEQQFLNNNKIMKLLLNSNGLVSQTILNSPNSFGFVSLESLHYFDNKPNIRLIPLWVKNDKVTPPIDKYDPTANGFKQDIFNQISLNGDYYFWHPLNTVINIHDKKIQMIKNFFNNWYLNLNIDINKIIDQNGYIPILGYTGNDPKQFKSSTNYFNLFIAMSDLNKHTLNNDDAWRHITKNYNPDNPWWTWQIDSEWLGGYK